jgi:glycosyltransferase involved in cell wall biosynthesis
MNPLLIDKIDLPWKDRLRNNFHLYGRKYPHFKGTVYLFTPTLYWNDAVSKNVLETASILSLAIDDVQIFAERPLGKLDAVAKTWTSFPRGSVSNKDVFIYHHSIGNDALADIVHLPVQKHVVYFGVTPPEYTNASALETRRLCQKGLDDLVLLDRFKSWTSNSQYTMGQLEAIQTSEKLKTIVPPFLSMDRWDDIETTVAPAISLKILNSSFVKKLLYLGRRTESKNIEGLIKIFSELIKLDPLYSLVIAGGGANPEYHQKIQSMVTNLGLERQIFFTDEPSDTDLKYLYQHSLALVTASHHEGFCVPLAEAMKFKIPAFAPHRTAMGETLGTSEGFIDDKDEVRSAQLIHGVLSDPIRRSHYIETQQQHYLSKYCDAVTTANYFNLFDHIFR